MAPTHHDPPPRQEGETVASSCLRQVRDGAGVGGRAREQFNGGEEAAITPAANYQLTWCKVEDELIKTISRICNYFPLATSPIQALTSTRYPTRPELLFCYPNPTRTTFKKFRVSGFSQQAVSQQAASNLLTIILKFCCFLVALTRNPLFN